MSAPDEIRQLADRLDPEGLDRMSLGDLRAAAVALRDHANLIGVVEAAVYWMDVDRTDKRKMHSVRENLRAALAAAVSPPPTPTCPTCGSDNPAVQKVRGPGQRHCPNPWHQETT